jgi:hypothetical protein
MSFKNITQCKKVASVDGEVRGASYNAKLDAVALLSWNPVQLTLIGRAGTGAKSHNIGLDDVDDIVLLSRDTAVIKASSETWQVLDLAHKPRVDPLGNDARMLVGPQGEQALALRWDNTCDALTPGKNEVALRNFKLRGDHRAVDLGENECYVVADGGEGEFRIHPGATPEQGSLAKVELPLGSKKLDRVRGGKFLSAIYKKGGTECCIVRRAGNRVEPKLLHLDAQIADVVIAETCLVVVSKDGRALLYDPEALDKAVGGAVPKAELGLGCNGEPKVAVNARGNLFVGTDTGEVYMAVLLRTSVLV